MIGSRARAAGLVVAWGAAVGLLVAGCQTSSERLAAQEEARADEARRLESILNETRAGPVVAEELRVRLAFGSDVDLDLFVTDPLQESVYFANTPSRGGGALEGDLRCADSEPRVEVVRFREAHPGRYRIGVDFPERCDEGKEDTSFVVEVESGSERGSLREIRWQTIRLRTFELVVLEFDLP